MLALRRNFPGCGRAPAGAGKARVKGCRSRARQAREHGIDTFACSGRGHPQPLYVGVACIQARLPFLFARGELRLQRLPCLQMLLQFGAQSRFGGLCLGQLCASFVVEVVKARLQFLRLRFGRGATLTQGLRVIFGMAQAGAQRIAFGLKLVRALDELPDTGGELI